MGSRVLTGGVAYLMVITGIVIFITSLIYSGRLSYQNKCIRLLSTRGMRLVFTLTSLPLHNVFALRWNNTVPISVPDRTAWLPQKQKDVLACCPSKRQALQWRLETGGQDYWVLALLLFFWHESPPGARNRHLDKSNITSESRWSSSEKVQLKI